MAVAAAEAADIAAALLVLDDVPGGSTAITAGSGVDVGIGSGDGDGEDTSGDAAGDAGTGSVQL